MMTRVRTLTVLCLAAWTVGCAQEAPPAPAEPAPEPAAEVETHAPDAWGYEGAVGADAWGSLSEDYALCASGTQQSPIDLVGATAAELPALTFDYAPFTASVTHDGHALKVAAGEGSSLSIGEDVYQLVQLHFHAASEHTVEGQQLPLELHFVHANAEGALAVVGVLFEQGEGEAPAGYAALWGAMPAEATKGAAGAELEIDPAALLPAGRSTWRYEGSLTTPPCSEGVRWHVLTERVTLSAEQIAAASALLNGNFRPVQPLGERQILTDAG